MKVVCERAKTCTRDSQCGAKVPHDSGHCEPCPFVKTAVCVQVKSEYCGDCTLPKECQEQKDRIAALIAENIILDGRVKTRDERIKELEAALAKYEGQLNNCTSLLEKHWPSSMSCNGLLQVAGHLKVILLELAKHEWVSVDIPPTQSNGLDGMYPIIVNGGLRLGMYSTMSKRWLWRGMAVYPTYYSAIISLPGPEPAEPEYLPDQIQEASDE